MQRFVWAAARRAGGGLRGAEQGRRGYLRSGVRGATPGKRAQSGDQENPALLRG